MPRRALRLAVLSTTSAVASLALAIGTLTPAQADDSPPPVTGDDTITIEARSTEFGGVSFVDVLANDQGEDLQICRLDAPRKGLSVAEVQLDGSWSLDTPHEGYSFGSDAAIEEGAHERLVVLPWHNRAGTFQFTYWACDTVHLTPATVTVTVEETPEVTVRKTDRPGRLRFTNPRAERVLVFYGGLRQERPDGRVRLSPRSGETRRVERRAIFWVAFSPRTGQPLGEGVVRHIQLPPASTGGHSTARVEPELTPRMLRAWHQAQSARRAQ